MTTKAPAAKAETTKAPAAKAEVKLVKMSRDAEQHPAPHTADVHPDEVENFEAGGWTKEG